MTTTHPDELLDRAAAGHALSTSERAFLATHLRHCNVCQFLQQVKDDLHRDDLATFDRGRTKEKEGALVTATLAALSRPGATVGRSTPLARGRSTSHGGHGRGATFRATLALAACVVLGAGGLALAHYVTRAKPTPTEGEPSAIVAAHDVAEVAALNADALFAEAREARLHGRAADTKRLYKTLWRRFPTTPEGQAGRAIFGRWLLDRGEPAAALPVLADYLRLEPAGPLDEEARVGTAEAWEQLHRPVEARAAWNDLVTRHPQSVHALRATSRRRDPDGRAGAP